MYFAVNGNALSHYSWLKLPWYTIPSYLSWVHLSQVIKEYAPVISHHQSKSLMITKSQEDSDLKCSHE